MLMQTDCWADRTPHPVGQWGVSKRQFELDPGASGQAIQIPIQGCDAKQLEASDGCSRAFVLAEKRIQSSQGQHFINSFRDGSKANISTISFAFLKH